MVNDAEVVKKVDNFERSPGAKTQYAFGRNVSDSVFRPGFTGYVLPSIKTLRCERRTAESSQV